MATYDSFPFSDIRSLIWSELKDKEILDENDYWSESFKQHLNPIIPSQQVPEFQNLFPGQVYVVYDVETNSYDSEFWICAETATLNVIGNNYIKVYEILELIKDLFRRFDVSASDINRNSSGSLYRFLKTSIDGLYSPEYGEDEGGNVSGVIRIYYEYVREIDSSTGRYLY